MKNIILFLIVSCCIFMCAEANTAWRTLSSGLEYTKLSEFIGFPEGYVHAFRIDLKHYQLKALPLRTKEGSNLDIAALMLSEHAVVAANGGFFSENLNSLGLRIADGREWNLFKPISWWGVFLIRNGKATLMSSKEHVESQLKNSLPVFAIEAGPRLLENGRLIPQRNSEIDYRTVLCITQTGKVILLATENVLLSIDNLGSLLKRHDKEGGLDCVDAINLDGGHSTQLYAHLPGFSLKVGSGMPVADAVLVVPLG